MFDGKQLEAELPRVVRNHLATRAGELFFQGQVEEVLRRVPADRSPVLDLGCGSAPLAPSLLERGQAYVGVDRDPAMVAGAALRLAGAGRAVHAEAETLPFEDETFAVVVSLGMFEYVTDHVAVLTEVSRVLKPGGLVAITVPRRDAPYRRAQALVAPALRLLGKSGALDILELRDISRKQLESSAVDAGLTVIAYSQVSPGVLPFPFDWYLPRLARSLAGRAGSTFGTARFFLFAKPGRA